MTSGEGALSVEAPPSTERTVTPGRVAAPASWRHERRRRPRRRAHPRDRALGRGARRLLTRVARIARRRRSPPARIGRPRSHAAADARIDPGRRVAQHTGSRGSPRWRRLQRAVRGGRSPGERTSRRPVAVRLRSAARGAARAAGRTEGPLPPADDAPQHRRHSLHRAVDAARVPGAVGRHRTARHDGPPPARADSAAARVHLRHPSPREPSRQAGRGRDAPPRGRPAGIRVRDGPGSRHPRRVERQPPRPRRAGHDRRGVPRRRRAARSGRGHPRAGRIDCRRPG